MAHLLSKCNLGENEQQLVELIQRSGKALMTVINDILDFSRIEAGRLILDETSFSLRQCIKDVAALLMMAAAEKDVELIIDIQPDLPEYFVADAGRIRQIITNIMGNAVKFTGAGHVRVDVSARRAETVHNLLISVKDTGIGIPQDMKDEIFNKFQQADSSAARKFEGTGLGLSIAKRLANVMGGDIMVDSVLGEGSRFDIALPLQAAHYFLEKKKTLIIKDDPELCKNFGESYRNCGAKVVPVCSMKRAFMALDIAAQKNIAFDLILLDADMTEAQETQLTELLTSKEDLHGPIRIKRNKDNQLRAKRMTAAGLNVKIVDSFEIDSFMRSSEPQPSEEQVSEGQASEEQAPETRAA